MQTNHQLHWTVRIIRHFDGLSFAFDAENEVTYNKILINLKKWRIKLKRDWESTFSFWLQSPSKTEQERCERVIRSISAAIDQSTKFRSKKVMAFPQGSFRNRVNVRQNCDVDVGVMLYQCFLAQYPRRKGNSDLGFNVGHPAYGVLLADFDFRGDLC